MKEVLLPNTGAKGTAAGGAETRSILGFGIVVRADEYNLVYSKMEALRAENERLKYREKNCATENQALLVGAVKFMQEVSEAVGMTMDDSPPQILERLARLLKRGQKMEARLAEDQRIFMSYARIHSEKGTDEGNTKAAANAGIVIEINEVLCAVQS